MNLRTKLARAALFGVACAFGALGCERTEAYEGVPTAAPALGPVGPKSVIIDGFGRPTTDGAVALGNLDATISAYRSFLVTHPAEAGMRSTLVGLLLSRSQFSGTFSDLDEALELATVAVKEEPEEPKAHQLLASALGATHRFDESRAQLETAAALGADVTLPLATTDLAIGKDLGSALENAEQAVAQSRTFGSLTALAGIEAARGRFERADALFLEAVGSYHDVSPFPVAWVAFQRGLMWSELAARRDLGRPLYAEAVRRLPGYVVANVHLAELEAASGDAEAAIARLGPLAASTADPEPDSRLAQFLAPTDPAGAALASAKAAAGYTALLAKHPLAFADHAAEYYLGAGGDPKRGLGLALENLEHRKNDRAYVLAIHAAMANERTDLACELSAEAGGARASIPLKEVQLQLSPKCK